MKRIPDDGYALSLLEWRRIASRHIWACKHNVLGYLLARDPVMQAEATDDFLRAVDWKGELMTFRTAYDSTTPEIIPADAQIVGYYPHAWGTDLSHIKAAIEVRIDNRGNHYDDCHMLDIEQDAGTIAEAPHWIQSWHAGHPQGMHTGNGFIRKPIIYISESRVPELHTACAGLDYDLWVAAWGIGPTVIPGAMAHQYTNRGPNGENYDMSVVTDPTWGLPPQPQPQPPAPTPAPVPAPQPSTYGVVVWFGGTPTPISRVVHSTDGAQTWH